MKYDHSASGVRVERITPTPHCPFFFRHRTAIRRTGRTYIPSVGRVTYPNWRLGSSGSVNHSWTLAANFSARCPE